VQRTEILTLFSHLPIRRIGAIIQSLIQVRHLEYTYLKSEIPAVRDVDFDVARGEVFGFLGPSG
jgi:ABC-type glutathione transport system ATPase component